MIPLKDMCLLNQSGGLQPDFSKGEKSTTFVTKVHSGMENSNGL